MPRRHVFRDLLPYICTFSDCKDELRQFATRQAWADHEFNEHRIYKTWTCRLCSYECSQSTNLIDHLREGHIQCFSESQISTAMSTACTMKSKPTKEEKCLLCDTQPSTTRRAFIAHNGKHMEEVALMALPRENTDESGNTSVSSDDTNRSYREKLFPLDPFHQTHHILDYDSSELKCGFCNFSTSRSIDPFSAVESFKKHLVSAHGVGRNPLERTSRCTACSATFVDAQVLYDHVQHCFMTNAFLVGKKVPNSPYLSSHGNVRHASFSDTDLQSEEQQKDGSPSTSERASPAKGIFLDGTVVS